MRETRQSRQRLLNHVHDLTFQMVAAIEAHDYALYDQLREEWGESWKQIQVLHEHMDKQIRELGNHRR